MNAERERWHVLQRQLAALQREIRDLPLPDYFDEPCDCGLSALQVVEPGYVRWEAVDKVDAETRMIHANTDGWSSLSETGYVEYLECRGCGGFWSMPDQVDWD